MMCIVPEEDSCCLLWLMCAAVEGLKLGVFLPMIGPINCFKGKA